MKAHFVTTGLVYVALIALIAAGLGSFVRSLSPTVALAAPAGTTTTTDAAPPRIVAVAPAEDGRDWLVQLDTGDQFAIERRVFETGGVAPTPGPTQSFTDHTLLVGVCAGYDVITDGVGTVYHGFRL